MFELVLWACSHHPPLVLFACLQFSRFSFVPCSCFPLSLGKVYQEGVYSIICMYSSTQSTQADNQVHRYYNPTFQVVTILVAMVPKILELATWLVKKSPLTKKSWLPNGNQAKTFTWRVETKHKSKQTDKRQLFYQKSSCPAKVKATQKHTCQGSTRLTDSLWYLLEFFPSDIWHLQQWFLCYGAGYMYQHITALTWVGTRTEQGRNNWSFL